MSELFATLIRACLIMFLIEIVTWIILNKQKRIGNNLIFRRFPKGLVVSRCDRIKSIKGKSHVQSRAIPEASSR